MEIEAAAGVLHDFAPICFSIRGHHRKRGRRPWPPGGRFNSAELLAQQLGLLVVQPPQVLDHLGPTRPCR